MNFRVAVRSLWRSKAFTAVAVLTLVLGIGAITAMFSVVNTVLLKPLAGVDTERIVLAAEKWPRFGSAMARVRVYREWRKLNGIFDEIAARQYCNPNFTGLAEPEQLKAPCVTANWFAVYGATALLGRTFLPGEDQPGHDQVIVLDHGFWLRRFGANREIIGRAITLDQKSYTVIGVMPPDFQPDGKSAAQLYMPWLLDKNEMTNVTVTARLRHGITVEAATAALNVIAKRFEKDDPDDAGLSATVTPLIETVVGPQRDLLRLLLAGAAMVLLVACVNVANLFLARTMAKRKETEIRAQLGASRWQLLPPALAESAIVSSLGAGLGLLAAWAIARVLAANLQNFPRADEIQVDTRVLFFTLVVTIATIPMFIRRSVSANPRRRINILVVAEVSLTLTLLISSGLLMRSFAAMRQVDLGYQSQGVISGFLSQPEDAGDRREAAVQLRARVVSRIANLPGVASAATSSRLPPGGVGIGMTVVREGENPNRSPGPGEKSAQVVISSPDYFRAAGIPLRAGRTFTTGDTSRAPRVAIVSQTIANQYFDGNVLGRRILLPDFGYNLTAIGDVIAREIVGVVADIKETSVRETGHMTIYLPEAQAAVRFTNLVVRAATSGDPLALERSVRHIVYEEAPELAVNPMQRLDSLNSYLTDEPRRAMWLLGVFAALALILAAVGVHGVVALATLQRTREMGIRMALGARPGQIFGLISKQALQLAIVGATIGIAIACAATRLLQSLLFGVARVDPATYAAGALLLICIAALASFAPALRAARTDPAVTLRSE